MTDQGTDTATPAERGSTLLRPAVSPRSVGEAPAAGALDHPLGPFRRLLRDLYEAEPMAALISERVEDGDDEWPADSVPTTHAAVDLDQIDLATEEEPWLDPTIPEPAPALTGGAIALPDFLLEQEDEMGGDEAFWLDFDAMGAPAAESAPEAPEMQATAPELQDAELSLDDEARVLTDVVDAGLPSPPAGEAGVSRADPSRGTVVEEVAVRLERIARSLRERSPAELLGRSDDPLQVLIAGYVLGLSDTNRGGPGGARGDDRE